MDTVATAQISKDEFPILQHGLYANHAAIAPWPRRTSEAVIKFAEENCQQGPEKYPRWLLQETRLRERLATLINAASADDIALLKNTTEGICTIANGIDWHKGDNMVLPLDEFPSNRIPWLALRDSGVEVREVDIRSTSDPEQALLARMDKRTRLLSVSAEMTFPSDDNDLLIFALSSNCFPVAPETRTFKTHKNTKTKIPITKCYFVKFCNWKIVQN